MSERIIWRVAEEACSRNWEFSNGQEENHERWEGRWQEVRILTSRTFIQRYEAERHSFLSSERIKSLSTRKTDQLIMLKLTMQAMYV
jgi:hypothetical protein